MIRWLRVVLPRGEFVGGVFLVMYVLCEAFYWLSVGFGIPPRDTITSSRDMVVFGTAVWYGLSRVTRFHPLYDSAYREWLEKTPWTADRPLPVGPVHLVPQDVLVVLVLTALTLPRLLSDPSLVPLGFLFAYLTGMALSLWPTGAPAYAYGVAFGLGGVLRLWLHPLVALAVATALYLLAWAGLKDSLRRFPWDVPRFFRPNWWKSSQKPADEFDPDSPRQRLLGWPFDRLSPRPDPPTISARDGTLVSLLAGWWIYALAATVIDALGGAGALDPGLVYLLIPVSFMLLAIGAVIRSTLYCWAHKPPITFWGRIRTFRWIIPGYDRATLVPAASLVLPQMALVVAGVALPRGLVSPAVLCALPITLGLLILLNGQPPLRRWMLTGQHRIVPGYTKNKTMPALTGDYFDEVVEI